MKHWVEYYLELYARENTVTEETLDTAEMHAYHGRAWYHPVMDEMSIAVDTLTTGRTLGKNGISKLLICHRPTSQAPLWTSLPMFERGLVPWDMRDVNIVTLYKNKGDRNDCNNHANISLLSIVGKLITHVTLKRLQALADRVDPESQCGFRQNRLTINMLFSLRQLKEKCREQGKLLYIVFINLKKAFDLKGRDGLFNILSKIGCPTTLLSIMKSFHNNMKGTIVYEG